MSTHDADHDDGHLVERTLLEQIAERLPSLRASEGKVATWVLENPAVAAELNLAGLADATGVSEPTVVRFCSAIGIGGFRPFKLALVRALALGDAGAVASVSKGDEVDVVVSKTVDRTINALDRTRRYLASQSLTRAADCLAGATEIIFVGAGTSGVVALDAQQKFPLFGVPCFAPLDFHEQFMAASLASERTVVVAISNSARTKTVIDVAKAARAAGGQVIALVGDDGPLARAADVVVRTSTFEDTEVYTPTVSRIAELVVIDVLASLVALKKPDERARRVSAMKEALSRVARQN